MKNKPGWIACDLCNQWWHGNCVNLTKQILGIFREKNLSFNCPQCIVAGLQNSANDNSTPVPQTPGNVIKDQLKQREPTIVNVKEQQQVDKKANCCLTDNNAVETERNTHPIKNLVILDGLRNPNKFQNNRDIKAEVKKHKGNLKIR